MCQIENLAYPLRLITKMWKSRSVLRAMESYTFDQISSVNSPASLLPSGQVIVGVAEIDQISQGVRAAANLIRCITCLPVGLCGTIFRVERIWNE
jgi:hypothetical protein